MVASVPLTMFPWGYIYKKFFEQLDLYIGCKPIETLKFYFENRLRFMQENSLND